MTVYVDDMRAAFGRYVMCHMIADTEAELHAMADAIGVARKWCQGDHYDIARSKRALALAAGAVAIAHGLNERLVMVDPDGSTLRDVGQFKNGACPMARAGKRHTGAMIDGREWREFP